MEQILRKLSEIETTADEILKDAERKKRALSEETERQCKEFDAVLEKETDAGKRMALKTEANNAVADMVKKEAADTLDKVLFELCGQMKNAFARSDA